MVSLLGSDEGERAEKAASVLGGIALRSESLAQAVVDGGGGDAVLRRMLSKR